MELGHGKETEGKITSVLPRKLKQHHRLFKAHSRTQLGVETQSSNLRPKWPDWNWKRKQWNCWQQMMWGAKNNSKQCFKNYGKFLFKEYFMGIRWKYLKIKIKWHSQKKNNALPIIYLPWSVGSTRCQLCVFNLKVIQH